MPSSKVPRPSYVSAATWRRSIVEWQNFSDYCHFCHSIGRAATAILSGMSRVTELPAADPTAARTHFEALLAYETDCWDVHASLGHAQGFVLLDVRAPQSFEEGHVPGAISLPHGKINERNLAAYPADTLFVVYCNGPHCNGADRAAARLARLGRPVKKMIGGVEGWKDEGFRLVTADRT
jgi:rhodanese-related sulfurtransferase